MMANIGYSMAFDLIILLLLVATMVYAIKLNRKLSVLRDTKDEMADMIARFTQATNNAEQGLGAMKEMASGSNAELEARLAKADELRKDLAFLVDKAEGACGRLETAISRGRQTSPGSGRGVEGLGRPAAMAASSTKAGGKRSLGGRHESAASAAQSQLRLSPNESNLLKALQGLR